MDNSVQMATMLGFPVHLVTESQAQAVVREATEGQTPLQVVTLNPEMIMQGRQDTELGGILKTAGLILPDGAGLVWALRQQGHTVSRLPGIEFSDALLAWAAQAGQPVAIIGATADVLEAAVKSLQARYAGLQVVYRHHGFFQSGEAETQVVEACAATHPKVVLVALGVPRQEKWIHRYKARFPGAVLVGVGGSLDVWSGKTRRAPAWMRRLNLEWLYRITSEPWRIQRTYKTLPLFVVQVLLARNES